MVKETERTQVVGLNTQFMELVGAEIREAVEDRGVRDPNRAVNLPLQIAPAEDETLVREVAVERSAEPIASEEDINRVVSELLQQERYRDAMLFVVGINMGLRQSDLVTLRFNDLIDSENYFKDCFKLIEIKTRNTRGTKVVVNENGEKTRKRVAPRKNRTIYINEAVRKIVRIYLDNVPSKRDDLLFHSHSNNSKNNGKGLSHTAIDNIFKKLLADMGVTGRYSTHFMRKTFCFHFLERIAESSGINTRGAEWLQYTLGHANLATTLRYSGYRASEDKTYYNLLNLGLEAINEYLGKK